MYYIYLIYYTYWVIFMYEAHLNPTQIRVGELDFYG